MTNRHQRCIQLFNRLKAQFLRVAALDDADRGFYPNQDSNNFNRRMAEQEAAQFVALLARRPCSKGEISQSLRRHHYADDVTELVIYKLEKENLLNDQEFSELWVQQRSRKYGSRRIRQELRVKGVPESTAEKALSSVSDEEMLESATSLAVKAWSRAKPGEDPRKTRQRIISSLVRKGFDWDLARQASDTAESETIF